MDVHGPTRQLPGHGRRDLLTERGERGAVADTDVDLERRAVVVGGPGQTGDTFDVEHGTELHSIQCQTEPMSVAFLADGTQILYSLLDGSIMRWIVGSAESRKLPCSGVLMTTIVGGMVATADDRGTICFWNAESGKEDGRPCVAGEVVKMITLSPDAKILVSATRNGTIQAWDVEKRTEMWHKHGYATMSNTLAFSPDGRLLAAAKLQSVSLFDANTGDAFGRPFIGHTHQILCIAFSADGTRFKTGSGDGTVRIWDVKRATAHAGLYVEELCQDLAESSLDDGWIRSPSGELLLWVPPDHRNGIRDMCSICIPASAPGHPVRLDWSKLAKGKEWTEMFQRS